MSERSKPISKNNEKDYVQEQSLPERLDCERAYPMMRDSDAASPLGRSFVWVADMQKTIEEPLYIDAFHYTAPMSRRIAEFIIAAVRERNLAKVGKK